jgi:hypothetical protein
VSAVSDLFARSLIDTYVTDDRDFGERPSVDATVRGAVADPNCRFLLITGSPGTGKTALMAEGMEWLSVVRTTSPVLPRLGRVGDPDLLARAFQRLVDLAIISWPDVAALEVLAGDAQRGGARRRGAA